MISAQSIKAARKESAVAAANDKGPFEETAFGRRRVSQVPKVLSTLGRLVVIPLVFFYRGVRRSRGAQKT